MRAAEELRNAVDIDVRIGVDTGEVVTGSADKLVTGDAVNVAARLEQASDSGDVLLGESTYRLVRGAVEAELLPPIEAKGKTEPLTAYRLVAVTGDVAVARRQDAPLGRDRERRMLADAWERSRSEQACSLFTILGTAGAGKSRLTANSSRASTRRSHGRCFRTGRITYWPVVEVVKQVLASGEAPNPGIAALLGDGRPGGRSPCRCESSSNRRPPSAARVLDDLQWAEPTFLDLIERRRLVPRRADPAARLARPELSSRARPGGGKLNATAVLLEPCPQPRPTS